MILNSKELKYIRETLGASLNVISQRKIPLKYQDLVKPKLQSVFTHMINDHGFQLKQFKEHVCIRI